MHPKAEEDTIILIDEDEPQKEFKQFDVITGNHPYHKQTHLISSETISVIREEWEILEDNLPDSIFVRAYEGTTDRLTAIIIGPPGTPYHHGLFFYDIQITSGYPFTRPNIFLLNPETLRPAAKPSSFLVTNNKQLHSVTEILQRLRANLINSEPKSVALDRYTDEHLLEKDYATFYITCRLMLATLKKPPRYFERFVAKHFRDRAESILLACKSFIVDAESKVAEDQCVQIVVDRTSVAIKQEHERYLRSMKRKYYRLLKAFLKNGSTNCLESIYDIGDMDDIDETMSCSEVFLFCFVCYAVLAFLTCTGMIILTNYRDNCVVMVITSWVASCFCGLACLLLKITGCDFPLRNDE